MEFEPLINILTDLELAMLTQEQLRKYFKELRDASSYMPPSYYRKEMKDAQAYCEHMPKNTDLQSTVQVAHYNCMYCGRGLIYRRIEGIWRSQEYMNVL